MLSYNFEENVGASDDERESTRRSVGVSRQQNIPQNMAKHKDPSWAGTRGYPVPQRNLLMTLYQSGESIPLDLLRSVQRWIKNGPVPKRIAGGKKRDSPSGYHLLLLAIFKRIYPQASKAECALFIAIYSDDGYVLSDYELHQGYRMLKYTLKRCLTMLYCAFTPQNLYLYD